MGVLLAILIFAYPPCEPRHPAILCDLAPTARYETGETVCVGDGLVDLLDYAALQADLQWSDCERTRELCREQGLPWCDDLVCDPILEMKCQPHRLLLEMTGPTWRW